jgi:Tannase and feruloyl esterase
VNNQPKLVWAVPFAASGLLLGTGVVSPTVAAKVPSAQARCEALPARMEGQWPDTTTRVISVHWDAAGALAAQSMGGPSSVEAPAHCELIGTVQERIGEDGQHYAIRFHLRLPERWNSRFLFQGGGGSNGYLGDALGLYSAIAKPALVQGFAVLSQDSGHDNETNNDPAHGGTLVFGFDEQSRADYGNASLPIVSDAAKAAVRQYYGKSPRHAYFVGCSKGGEEGMALAQRYASEFDGIVANSPGMSLPRAAVAEAWDTQTLASLVKTPADSAVQFTRLPTAFSDADLAIVRDAVLAACDADDGLKDGLVDDFPRCTSARVDPQLNARQCQVEKIEGCLSGSQIQAMDRLMLGPHDSSGRILYSDWPWDAGIASPGWRQWKMGAPTGMPPSLNVVLGGASLASVFTTPPTLVTPNPQQLLNYLLGFDFDKDPAKIYATDSKFPRSSWDDISARSADLAAFRKHGAKMIVVHGVSDPVFSINDTLTWWREVDQINHGGASEFVRVFPVPGMNHCGGGDAPDQFDALAPLMQWVEHDRPPDRIIATSDQKSTHPGRSRPLCPYPSVAHYLGSGDVESAQSFSCH